MAGLAAGAYQVGAARMADLAQGQMVVEDVACGACGEAVGWRFDQALGFTENSLGARSELGRFGLVHSRIRPEYIAPPPARS
jgi:hypothetical protein